MSEQTKTNACPKCDLGVKPLPEVKSGGELIQIGGHVIDGMHCLTRQLAAAQARVAELEAECESLTSDRDYLRTVRDDLQRFIVELRTTNSGPAAEGA